MRRSRTITNGETLMKTKKQQKVKKDSTEIVPERTSTSLHVRPTTNLQVLIDFPQHKLDLYASI